MRYHLTPVRVAKVNNSGNNRSWQGCGERGTLLHCWWECKLVWQLLKTVWRFLKKLKIELPYNPAIAWLWIYPKDTGVLIHRDTCTPMFTAVLSTIAKVCKEPKCPSTDERIKKIMVSVSIHTHTHTHAHTHTMEYYSASKRMKFHHLQQHRARVYDAKWNKSEKDKYHEFTHMWNLRNKWK